MSLFDLVNAKPNITGTLKIRLDVLDLGSTTATNNLDTAIGNINISAASLPDVIAGTSGNNVLTPKVGTSVVIPSFSVSIRYPTYTLIDASSIISWTAFEFSTSVSNSSSDPISLTFDNTPNDFLVGFGGSDTMSGQDGNDVLIGDGLTPNEAGTDGNDSINAGSGNDVVIAGGGGDNINGDSGDDFILGDYFLGLPLASIPINGSDNVYSVTDETIAELSFLGFIPIADASYSADVIVSYGATLTFGSGNEGNDNILAGSGDDVVFADKGSDTLDGESGDDVLFGNAGADSISGGLNNDILFGDTLAPNFYGSDGADTLDGESGQDVLFGGGLGDNLSGGTDNDVIFGDYFFGFISGSIPLEVPPFDIPLNFLNPSSAVTSITLIDTSLPIGSGNEGSDDVSGGSGDDIILGDKGNDTLSGDSGNDLIIGGAGADSIQGGLDNDIILGDFLSPNFQGASTDGADRISGDEGNDLVLAGGGADSADGGNGDDVLFGDYFLGLYTASFPIDTSDLSLPPGFSIPSSISIGSGNEGNDTLNGGFGNDVVVGDKGEDLLSGGDGNDVIIGAADADSINGGADADVILGDLLSPDAYGNDGADDIDAGLGDDIIIGGGLGDVIYGGDGDDFILGDYFLSLPIKSPILIPLTANNPNIDFPPFLFSQDANDPFGGYLSFIDLPIDVIDVTLDLLPQLSIPVGSGNEGDDYIDAGSGNDVAFADRGDDSLLGGTGNDILIGGGDNDTARGGLGDDLLVGDSILPPGTVIKLSAEVAKSLDGFLNVSETGEFTFDNGPQGNDLLEGGAGNDLMLGNGGIDTVTYENDPGRVIVNLGSIFNPGFGTATDGYGNSDILIEIENIIGSQFDDQLTGDSNVNIIIGLDGDDIISSLAGDDTLDGGDGNDNISAGDGDDFLVGSTGGDFLDGGFGVDTASYRKSDFGVVVDLDVFLGVGFGYSGDARGDTLINIENLEGSDFVDQLWGNSFSNLIEGFDGDDQLFGRGGDDFLDGGNGSDILRGGEGLDTLYGQDGVDNLLGEAGNDFLYGGNGFDEVTGGDGDDRLFGECDKDRVFGDAGNDQVFGGDGNDTLHGGFGLDYLDGGTGDDSMLGQDGNDILDGASGNDTLSAGNGQDVVEGGFGIDLLTGGSGKDLFVVAPDPEIKPISSFQPNLSTRLRQSNVRSNVPYVRPGTYDTITDFTRKSFFGLNDDQIGLKNGIKYADLRFFGVASNASAPTTVNSTLIGYLEGRELTMPLVHVLNMTPDKFTSSMFVGV